MSFIQGATKARHKSSAILAVLALAYVMVQSLAAAHIGHGDDHDHDHEENATCVLCVIAKVGDKALGAAVIAAIPVIAKWRAVFGRSAAPLCAPIIASAHPRAPPAR